MKNNDTIRLCALSDTHGLDFTIPDCNIFCHCGDWSPLAYQSNFEAMVDWLDYFVDTLLHLPCRYVVIIAGNHDLIMESETARDVFDEIQSRQGAIRKYRDEHGILRTDKKIHYLDRSSAELMGLKFWGSPVTQQVNRYRKYWAFETNRPSFDIPSDTDIILTHQPPEWKGLGNVLWGINDPSEPLGCKVLTDAVMQTQAIYHFCGHIHTGNHEVCRYPNGTIGVNVSMLDEGYEARYEPFSCVVEQGGH
jgi:hypothetical protein